MKTKIILSGTLAMLAMASCQNNSTQKDSNETPPSVETPAPAEKKTVVVDPNQKDGTTIKVNDEGMSIENKDGSKKNNVNISKDSTSIEISRPK